MGASVAAGPGSELFADEHDASVSVTTRATTNLHARKIMGRPYVQTPNLANAKRRSAAGSGRVDPARWR